MDGLLEATTPEQMDEWIAFAMIEPFGDQWRQTATIAAQVNNSQAASQDAVLSADDFLPDSARVGPSSHARKGRLMTPQQYEAVAAARWGK